MSAREQDRVVIAEVIVNAWRDEGYRARLIGDGAAVLREAGFALPPGCRVAVLENTDGIWHFAAPWFGDLEAGQKDQVVAELAGLLPLPEGVELHVHQDSEGLRHLVLPQPPDDLDALSDGQLELVVGGLGAAGGNGGAGGLGGLILLAGNGGAGGTAGLF